MADAVVPGAILMVDLLLREVAGRNLVSAGAVSDALLELRTVLCGG